MTGPKIRTTFPGGKKTKRGTKTEAKPSTPHPSRAAQMLALAHHVERLVEAGELTGYAEAARSLGLTRARMTQVMNLLLLAPEIQEQVLVRKINGSERRLRKVVKEADWCRQLEICVRSDESSNGSCSE